MASFRLTADAQTDLIEIRRYTLNQWGKEQSKKYLTDLRQTIQLLSENPNIGIERPEVGPNIYSFVYVSHVIYYLVSKRKLVVFAVLHKSMLPLLHLNNRDTD